MKTPQKIIFWLFWFLIFFTPLILWPFTSEVFEFNKMVLVYILTTLIVSTWSIRMILEKKIIFRRTLLDIPLIVFIASNVISTILSIAPLTSLLGYYSRFNGGLLSILCYCLLYWALVSNVDAKRAMKLIYALLSSAVLVSIYGVLEHFGIDKNIWQQDVQARVFSTLGQPNWLAAWLVALIPIGWVFITQKHEDKVTGTLKFIFFYSFTVLLFITLLFTGSRSGLLGFATTDIIFWGLILFKHKKEFLKEFIICNLLLAILALVIGTQLTPSIGSLMSKSVNKQAQTTQTGATSLETGGTESGTIRRIVWKGALQVWLHYPIFGSGVETFAYSYYLYRPVEHNLTSEWNFIYNKAHNEYLNFAANNGTVGLISYLVLIGFAAFSFIKFKSSNSDLNFALLAGFISLLVTNFFGFSVVPTQIELFLFPAFALTLAKSEEEKVKNVNETLNNNQKTLTCIIIALTFYLLFLACRYWYADYLFATAKGYNSLGKPDVAIKYLTQAINLEPNQALFYGDPGGLAASYANIALAFNQQKQTNQTTQFSNAAISEINRAISLSPADVNFKRVEFGIYVMLSTINPNYLIDARDTLITAIAQAPTDAKLYYNLGLIYARTGQTNQAIETLAKTIDLKADYKEARLAYAILLVGQKQNSEAKTQLEYILTNIDPKDSLTKQTLESIK